VRPLVEATIYTNRPNAARSAEPCSLNLTNDDETDDRVRMRIACSLDNAAGVSRVVVLTADQAEALADWLLEQAAAVGDRGSPFGRAVDIFASGEGMPPGVTGAATSLEPPGELRPRIYYASEFTDEQLAWIDEAERSAKLIARVEPPPEKGESFHDARAWPSGFTRGPAEPLVFKSGTLVIEHYFGRREPKR
jgi:hypothetical protein